MGTACNPRAIPVWPWAPRVKQRCLLEGPTDPWQNNFRIPFRCDAEVAVRLTSACIDLIGQSLRFIHHGVDE